MIVDTGLHYVGFSRDEALEYFSKYAWDDTDIARKEVHPFDVLLITNSKMFLKNIFTEEKTFKLTTVTWQGPN